VHVPLKDATMVSGRSVRTLTKDRSFLDCGHCLAGWRSLLCAISGQAGRWEAIIVYVDDGKFLAVGSMAPRLGSAFSGKGSGHMQ
jgi:hypothetical protein